MQERIATDAAEREIRGIGLHYEGQVRLEVLEDGSNGEGFLQGLESCTRRMCHMVMNRVVYNWVLSL